MTNDEDAIEARNLERDSFRKNHAANRDDDEIMHSYMEAALAYENMLEDVYGEARASWADQFRPA